MWLSLSTASGCAASPTLAGNSSSGEPDDSAEACRQMVAQPHTEDAQLDLTVYPGAYHAFDVREL